MRSSIIDLTAKEMNSVAGGESCKEITALLVVGFLGGLKFYEITAATVYADNFWLKTVGIVKEASFYTILSMGTVMTVNKIFNVLKNL